LSKDDKIVEFKRIQQFNKDNKKKRVAIQSEFNLWKYLSYDISAFQDMKDSHQSYVIYLLLTSLSISTINKDKITLVIQWINSANKGTSLRIDNNVYLKKVDHFIKMIER
jgi:hypothetical protein